MRAFLVTLCFVAFQHLSPGWGQETPLPLSCKSRRTEISFPLVDDVAGRVTSFASLSSSPKDLLKISLRWRHHKLVVILFRNSVTSPGTVTEWTEGNVTYAKTTDMKCLYQGYVKGQRMSYAALSTCDGLEGYIQTDDELLFVQPANLNISEPRQAHVIYTCEPRQHLTHPQWRAQSDEAPEGRRIMRRRRAAQRPKYLEVKLVVDHTMTTAIGSKERTKDYVMTLMNIVNTVYQHSSLGMDIRVVVSKLIFLDRSQQRRVLSRNNALRTVNMFCEWSRNQIPAGQTMDYDISVLITKEVLGPSGYAPITGLCNPIRSCAAIHDEGFTTAFIIAHEMAHVFGLFHDGRGNNCYGRKYQTAMMSTTVESKLNHFWWSECSKRRMSEMVRYLFCLNNAPTTRVDEHYDLKAPKTLEENLGKPWSLDFQCRMEFGSHFRLCQAFYNDPCGTLWCSRTSHPHLCRTKRGPPLAGSSCGHQRICRNDQCQYVGNERPVNGYWSAWTSWSDCSTGCGVGIRRRSRVCDNPVPAYGGKDCAGESSRWDTCVNNTCTDYDDIRAGECSVWDDLQIRYGTHKWQPANPQNASTVCKQTCKSFYTKEIVTIEVDMTDGALCTYGGSSDICVEGKCIEVGCDGKRNSSKVIDKCGICGGDGSRCKVVKGTFNRKPKSTIQYVPVLVIPAGAQDITIAETKQSKHFLALKDDRFGTFPLNGDKRQGNNDRLIINGAEFIYNRSSHNHNESISSPGPLGQELRVMVYPNKDWANVSVTFQYTVNKDDFTLERNRYKWKFDKWSACSVTCGQGIQKILHSCQDKISEEAVDIKLCAHLDAPRSDEVTCVRQACGFIMYNFAMENKYGECNADCGANGTQIQLFHCERMNLNNKTYAKTAMHFCDHLEKPVHKKMCKGPPCQNEESVTYFWSSSEWSECMSGSECGLPGHHSRNVTCEAVRSSKPESNETVEDEKCKETEKPDVTKMCEAEPCPPEYEWFVSDTWSECDCGGTNKQIKELTCMATRQEDGKSVQEEVEDKFCADLAKPDTSRQCGPCGPSYEWSLSDTWSECDCGGTNTQIKELTCMATRQEDGKSVQEEAEDKFCADLAKPDTSRPCGPCGPSYRWSVSGEFSPCTAECEKTGVEEAILICEQVTQSDQGESIERSDDFFCEDLEKPEVENRTCTGLPCKDVFQWISTDEWTRCRAPCEKRGKQWRKFKCEKTRPGEVTSIVENDRCDRKKRPKETRKCDGAPCPLKWSVGKWSECSVTCGRGKHYRKVYCGDPDTDLDDIRCKDRPPQTSKRCSRRPCPKVSDEECVDMYSFCASYRILNYRCKRDRFRRKCCRTCRNRRGAAASRPLNALEKYMRRRGLGRWRYSRRR